MKIDLQFKALPAKFKNNSALGFYVILFAILVMEIFIFSGAGKQILASRKDPSDLPVSRGVRFDFIEYELALKRIEVGKDFYPGPPLFSNPFGTK